MFTALRTVFLASILLLLSSCASKIPYHKSLPAPAANYIEAHVWSTLDLYGIEVEEYLTYTYVLSKKSLDSLRSENDNSYKVLNTLLTAIKGSTISSSNPIINQVDKPVANVFYIPSINSGRDYDHSKANHMISVLSSRFDEIGDPNASDTLEKSTGPFMVTSTTPLSRIDFKSEAYLFIDLSKSNPSAIIEIVEAYKSWTKSKAIYNSFSSTEGDINKRSFKERTTPERILEFKSLRLSFLSSILDLSDSITLVGPVLADIKNQI